MSHEKAIANLFASKTTPTTNVTLKLSATTIAELDAVIAKYGTEGAKVSHREICETLVSQALNALLDEEN